MKILVFGSKGLVGSSTVKTLKEKNIYKQIIASNRGDTNLFDFNSTYKTISEESPDVIVNAAARVGGIVANNTNRFEFIVENLKINLNILEAIKQEGAALERRGRADLTSYVAAQKQLAEIGKLKTEAWKAALATNDRFVELEQKRLETYTIR